MLGRVLFALGFAAAALVGCFGEATFTRQKSNVIAGCSADSDCTPAAATPIDPCVASVCLEQQCQTTARPAGTPVADQTPGDCLFAVCDGKGGITQQSDGADVFDDGNPCTLEGCSPDGPVMTQAPAGSVCADYACCDARAICTGSCVSDAECPVPPDGGCAMPWCNECGQCDLQVAVQGSLAAGDVPGDCVTLICDGSGTVVEVADPQDVPFDTDGDLCTEEVCDGETPTTKLVDCRWPQMCYMGVCG
jgi:hypothetical protein